MSNTFACRNVPVARIALVLAAAIALAVTPPAAAKLVVMHGFADTASALLWIQSEAPGPIEVTWPGADGTGERRLALEARTSNENIVVARLTDLAPGASVHYRISGDGETREGRLRTQPEWTDPQAAPEITIAIGSCFFLGDQDAADAGQPGYEGGFEIFDAIADKRPDLMLWLGDNLYFQRGDVFDARAMAARHSRQRRFEPLSRLLAATSHLAIWDDHDFGPNNSDRAYPMKAASLRLFKLYWANPGFGLPGTPGVFGASSFGDVDLILLDGRYHRSNARVPDGPDKSMFGAAQFDWLKRTLEGAKSRLKLVANGSQFWNAASRYDGLYQFAREQRSLADFLLAQRIEGLLFLSGDRHFTELLRIDRPGAYPLFEFTSSPLTSKPWEKPAERERRNPQVVPGTLVGKRQFGLIRVSGPGSDRTIELESYDQTGKLIWRHALRASELRF